mmetsp:Transcript_2885/g.7377  ORF Transcript_2885/g.7377 Transcript_2885/m.7377 type:complete len:200 (+) Transcript_2885:1073-1672(+)
MTASGSKRRRDASDMSLTARAGDWPAEHALMTAVYVTTFGRKQRRNISESVCNASTQSRRFEYTPMSMLDAIASGTKLDDFMCLKTANASVHWWRFLATLIMALYEAMSGSNPCFSRRRNRSNALMHCPPAAQALTMRLYAHSLCWKCLLGICHEVEGCGPFAGPAVKADRGVVSDAVHLSVARGRRAWNKTTYSQPTP